MTETAIVTGHLEIFRIVEELFQAIQAHCDSRVGATDSDLVYVSLTREISPIALLAIAKTSKAECKFYWRDRTGRFESVGLGAAESYVADLSVDPRRQVHRMLSHLEQSEISARVFGGLRFDILDRATECSEEWRRFYGGWFVLPLVELSRKDETYSLTVTVKRYLSQPAPEFSDYGYTNVCSQEDTEDCGSPTAEREIPNYDNWKKQIDRVSELIGANDLSKVVLARRVSFDCVRPVNPFALLERAFGGDQSATLFCFQPVPGIGFLGGTPELLLSRNGKNIYSEAVAGTRRASEVDRDGGEKGDAPNWSAKDRREIDIVRSAITEGLSAFCTEVECPTEPEIHRAGKIEHLRFPISGSLKGESSIADLVVALSPTPAVCGTPRENAMLLIRELERFDRGWYAGPVGWISKDSAEFAVAIRSALVCQKTVHLYSGAGIVQGSEARSEWDELDAKIATLRSALGA